MLYGVQFLIGRFIHKLESYPISVILKQLTHLITLFIGKNFKFIYFLLKLPPQSYQETYHSTSFK